MLLFRYYLNYYIWWQSNTYFTVLNKKVESKCSLSKGLLCFGVGQLSGGIVAVFAPAAVVDFLQDSVHRVVLCLLADMFAKGAFGFAV